MNFVKNKELNDIIWTIVAKQQLTLIPESRTFLSLESSDFSSQIEREIKECFDYLGRVSKCALLEKNEKGIFILRAPFDLDKIKEIALSNLEINELQPFINGIINWNTPQGIPIDNICHSFHRNSNIESFKDEAK